MTKERLEELIKQGATIWYMTSFGYLMELKLSDSHFEISRNKTLIKNCGQDGRYSIERLFETKEHYDWVIKMYAARAESFSPPMWEDLQNEYSFKFVVDQILYKFIVTKNNNGIGIYNATTEPDLFTVPATKENYIKACEIVRDLFVKGRM